MADVFEHNRLDILSLAALAAHLAELIDPEGETARRPSRRPARRGAALLWPGSCPGEAVRLLDPLCGCASPETAREADRELSLHHKRAGRWVGGGGDLGGDGEAGRRGPLRPHRARQMVRAQAARFPAGPGADGAGLLPAGCLSSEERDSLDHRRERLEKKLASLR